MTKGKKNKILFVSTLIIVIVQLVGFAGIHSAHHYFFLSLTSFNLLLSSFLLLVNHRQYNSSFYFFCFITFSSGYFIEVIGVATGNLFGEYTYGDILGVKILNVPLIIGVNWWMLVYSVGCICNALKTNSFIKSIAGALMLVALDFFIEPMAVKYDFWKWNKGVIPFQNYVAWFVFSFALLFLFNSLKFYKDNKLARALIIVQLVFFILLTVF